MFGDFFQKVGFIRRGRTMTAEDGSDLMRRWQVAQPIHLFRRQTLRDKMKIRRLASCFIWGVDNSILITRDAMRAVAHQQLCRASRIERAIDTIAKVENGGDVVALNIC